MRSKQQILDLCEKGYVYETYAASGKVGMPWDRTQEQRVRESQDVIKKHGRNQRGKLLNMEKAHEHPELKQQFVPFVDEVMKTLSGGKDKHSELESSRAERSNDAEEQYRESNEPLQKFYYELFSGSCF